MCSFLSGERIIGKILKKALICGQRSEKKLKKVLPKSEGNLQVRGRKPGCSEVVHRGGISRGWSGEISSEMDSEGREEKFKRRKGNHRGSDDWGRWRCSGEKGKREKTKSIL